MRLKILFFFLVTSSLMANANLKHFEKEAIYDSYLIKLDNCYDKLGRFQVPLSVLKKNTQQGVEYSISSSKALLLASHCKMALLDKLSTLLEKHQILYSSIDSLDSGGFLYVSTIYKGENESWDIGSYEFLESIELREKFKLNALYFSLLAFFIFLFSTKLFFLEDDDVR